MGEATPTLGEIRGWARYFYILKDLLRLRIILLLASGGEMTVSEIVCTLRVSQPLVSFHLGVLRRHGLVRVHREGRVALCSLNLSEIERRHTAFLDLLHGLTPGSQDRDEAHR